MRKLLTLAILTLGLAVSTLAQDVDKLPSITVTGTAEVKVAPDEVTFSLNVTKMNKELPIAKRQNDDAVAKILDLTRRFAIAPRDVKTDQISVEMKYESVRNPGARIYDEDGDEVGTRVFRGYVVSKTVVIKLVDISRFEEFFAETLKTGLSEVGSVTFSTSKLRETRDQARDMAMKAAREKASAMAGSIGQGIGKAVRITEGNAANRGYNQYSNLTANTVGGGGTFSEAVATFAPGAITISAEVTVTFLLN